jgi:VWFA-related protein
MQARVVALLLVFGSVAVATTQEPTTAQIPVRIVATDAKGRDVKNLTPADVEISEGNTGQKIQSLVRAGAGPRKIGILLDEYHVADGESVQAATAALLRFVEKSVRPDDVVFVMRPLDPAATLVPVKSLDELRKTIGDFAGRKGNYAPRTPFEAEYMSTMPPSVTRQRAQVVRAALQALVTVLNRSEPTGPTVPSALLLVSEGFAAEDRGRDRLTSLRVVARAARMSGIAVYVLDPVPVPPSASPFNEQWQALAAQTGGVLSSGAPLDAALARIATDLESQYVATIAASFKEDGAFHALDVKPKRKDLVVRAPSGYWTPIAAERYMASTRPPMSTYLKTPHVSGLIQPWFRMARTGSGRTQVTFSWAPKGNTKVTPANVTLSAVTFEGVKLHDADVEAQGRKANARATFEAVPGPIQVALTISDAKGKVLDTEVRYLDVPKLDAKGTMITAIEVLRTRTLREFLERQTQPDVMPAETRNFDRHDRLIVRVRALGASESPIVRARLLNTRGQPMRDLSALPDVDGMPQFELQLAPFARGDYHIEIRATAGSSTVSQLVTFRLVG